MIDTRFSVAKMQASQTGLPTGFQMRPATMEDLAAAVRVMNEWSSQVLDRNKFMLDEVRREWQEPGYNLEADSRLVVDPQGRIVGFQEVFDPGFPHVRIFCWGVVDPRFTGLGLESQLLNWAEEKGAPNGGSSSFQYKGGAGYPLPEQPDRYLGTDAKKWFCFPEAFPANGD